MEAKTIKIISGITGGVLLITGTVIYITKPFIFLQKGWLKGYAKTHTEGEQVSTAQAIFDKMTDDEITIAYTFIQGYGSKNKTAPKDLQTKFDAVNTKYNLGS